MSASFFVLLGSVLWIANASFAQTGTPPATCEASAVPALVRFEGLAERTGDVDIVCSGGTPGQGVSGNLTVFLNVNLGNRVSAQDTLDVVLTADNGSGAVPVNAAAVSTGPNALAINGLSVTYGAAGRFALRLSNLRADITLLQGPSQQVVAQLAFSAGALVNLTTSRLAIAIPSRGLLASNISTVISGQQGSPLPETVTFSSLLAAGTAYSSSRVTEGFASSFAPLLPMSTQGTRLLVRYAGLPPTARVFVPDYLAGADAQQPTAAGDYGGTVSGGVFLPGSSTLLLGRVAGSDGDGAGGSSVPLPGGTTPVTFDSVREVGLVNGGGVAVYEVLSANPSSIQSAQIPTFVGLARQVEYQIINTSRVLTFGPVSLVNTVSATAPAPRFRSVPAPTDCEVQVDCNGPYLPRLQVDPPSLRYDAASGADFQIRELGITNRGGGTLIWSASVAYANGVNWLRLGPSSGAGGAALRVDVLPMGLAPGRYDATVTVDAGAQAGTARIPVVLQVGLPVAPRPAITAVVNAASFAAGPLVRGSLGTIVGANLLVPGTSASGVTVTLDGFPAPVLFAGSAQINFQVPPSLGVRTSALLEVITANGRSAPFTAPLANTAPAIFRGGILNEDNAVNGPATPALEGSVVQVFATGLFPPDGGVVEVRIQDRPFAPALFAGPAPGLPGVQQVNYRLPAGLPATTTELVVCGTAGGQRVCSPAAPISVRR